MPWFSYCTSHFFVPSRHILRNIIRFVQPYLTYARWGAHIQSYFAKRYSFCATLPDVCRMRYSHSNNILRNIICFVQPYLTYARWGAHSQSYFAKHYSFCATLPDVCQMRCSRSVIFCETLLFCATLPDLCRMRYKHSNHILWNIIRFVQPYLTYAGWGIHELVDTLLTYSNTFLLD